MSKVPLALAAFVSLDALAWNASTAWQWNEDGRAGIYETAQSAPVSNAVAFGPRINLIRAGAASEVETLEARVALPVSLMGLVFEKYGFMLLLK